MRYFGDVLYYSSLALKSSLAIINHISKQPPSNPHPATLHGEPHLLILVIYPPFTMYNYLIPTYLAYSYSNPLKQSSQVIISHILYRNSSHATITHIHSCNHLPNLITYIYSCNHFMYTRYLLKNKSLIESKLNDSLVCQY